ncbi:MAG TPA: hypothetical protein VF660_07165 [Actinomycetota bacterium]
MNVRKWFNRRLKPIWDPASRFLQRIERGKLSKIIPRERHAEFERFLSQAASTPGVDRLALRFVARDGGSHAYVWVTYDLVREEALVGLRLVGVHLPGGPEDRFTTPDDLKDSPIFDAGRLP